jgi:hypothetical protein
MPISDLDTMVSVQTASTLDAVTGHLSWGVLWDRDVVLVPGPLGWLDQPRLEVLIARMVDDESADIVRISPRAVGLIGLTNHAEGAAGMVHLPGPIFDAPRRAVDPDRLNADIEALQDVWSALEAQHAVPPDLRSRPAADLAVVARWEVQQRADLVRDLRQPRFPPKWPHLTCIVNPRNCEPAGPRISVPPDR